MRGNAMLKSIRDTFFIFLAIGIGFLIYLKMDYFIKHPYGYQNNIETTIIVGIFWIAITYLSFNILASLGASILFDNSYTANKEIYKLSLGVFDDKLNGTLFGLKLSFFATLGMVVLPFALLYALINIRKLFESDKFLEAREESERQDILEQNENDITLKTPSKKWCVKDKGLLPTYYYFYDWDSAYLFAMKHTYDEPTKTIF